MVFGFVLYGPCGPYSRKRPIIVSGLVGYGVGNVFSFMFSSPIFVLPVLHAGRFAFAKLVAGALRWVHNLETTT